MIPVRFTLTFLEDLYADLERAVFSAPGLEGAAYVLCCRSDTEAETRLLARSVTPVRDEDYLDRTPTRLSIDSRSYARVAKAARENGSSILFVHSHPAHVSDFSDIDDLEEPKLMAFFEERAPGRPHGSVLIPEGRSSVGRVFVDATWQPLQRIRVLGRRFRFFDHGSEGDHLPDFLDRNVRAFGEEVQRLLCRLHVGIVGAGGTGSATFEQLVRLGVGEISVFDGDALERTNVNRVYGSSLSSAAMGKARLAQANADRIGVGTAVHAYDSYITHELTAKALRDCDIIFGCTDKETPRGLLVQLSLRYLIPVFDMGVTIDSEDQALRGVEGRVTTLYPGEACLFCRERITAEVIALESLPEKERAGLVREGYAPELATQNPTVVMFTTAVAAQAISECLHRLTGFMGRERVSSEVLLRFHDTEIRRNRQTPKPGCLCTQNALWGRGDSHNYLGSTWSE
jgi:molybdopterin/thiamine biosynthesis adenylyltransferase/proteasome lid subunit RPN8/RPN11